MVLTFFISSIVLMTTLNCKKINYETVISDEILIVAAYEVLDPYNYDFRIQCNPRDLTIPLVMFFMSIIMLCFYLFTIFS